MARNLYLSTSPVTGVRDRAVGAALLAVAAFALAGCQTGVPGSDASPSAASSSAATSPSPSATASPSSSATPGPAASAGSTTIEAPADGATVQGPAVTVSGTGTAFEATLLYLVLDADGGSVSQGFTTAGANGTIGPFSVDLTLEPGTYTVKVWEPSMAEDDASTLPVSLAQVTFTVG